MVVDALLIENNLCSKILTVKSIGGGCGTHFLLLFIYISTALSGGCINQAKCYETDAGPYFVKTNSDASINPVQMFYGESASLAHILAATASVPAPFAPKPLLTGSLDPKGGFIVTSYISLTSPNRKHQTRLGARLAEMHAAPPVVLSEFGPPARRFGFACDTMLGSTLQDNRWEDDYVTFWRERRLQPMLDNVLREHPHDTEIQELGQVLADGLPNLFTAIDVQPALLHGDLWSGNWGVDSRTDEPVIFDPACYYVGNAYCFALAPVPERDSLQGHAEAELSIMKMFGGFTQDFFDEYHKHFPKQSGFEKRQELYQLHHYLVNLVQSIQLRCPCVWHTNGSADLLTCITEPHVLIRIRIPFLLSGPPERVGQLAEVTFRM